MSDATLVISLDFELAWGSAEKWGDESFLNKARQAVDAAHHLLELFIAHDIPCTWATVGAMLARDKDEFLQFAPEEAMRPTYVDSNISPYNQMGSIIEANNDAFFCPEFIQKILNTPNQELGSHTFSHFYCLEDGQTLNQFIADLQAAQRIATKFNHSNTSLVFPRNQINEEYLLSMLAEGFNSFRGGEQSYVWKPKSRKNRSTWIRTLRVADSYINLSRDNIHQNPKLTNSGLVNIPSSRFLRPFSIIDNVFSDCKKRKLKQELSLATQMEGMYHLWFHPMNFVENSKQNMSMLLDFIQHVIELRSQQSINVKTMNMLASEHIEN